MTECFNHLAQNPNSGIMEECKNLRKEVESGQSFDVFLLNSFNKDGGEKLPFYEYGAAVKLMKEYKLSPISTVEFNVDNSILVSVDRNGTSHFYRFYPDYVILEYQREVAGTGRDTFLLDVNKQPILTYDKLQGRLTMDQYKNYLARNLKTLGALNFFQKHYMKYTVDSRYANLPLMKGLEDFPGEYWQTPSNTVQRVENGCMLGDCEDQAFFFADILRRQGLKAEVLLVPEHATTLWAYKNSQGKYHAYTIGSYGLDKNGDGFNYQRNKKNPGFNSLADAINAVVKKFKGEKITGVIKTGSVNDATRPDKRSREHKKGTMSVLNGHIY